jgi:hypothetical protein
MGHEPFDAVPQPGEVDVADGPAETPQLLEPLSLRLDRREDPVHGPRWPVPVELPDLRVTHRHEERERTWNLGAVFQLPALALGPSDPLHEVLDVQLTDRGFDYELVPPHGLRDGLVLVGAVARPRDGVVLRLREPHPPPRGDGDAEVLDHPPPLLVVLLRVHACAVVVTTIGPAGSYRTPGSHPFGCGAARGA